MLQCFTLAIYPWPLRWWRHLIWSLLPRAAQASPAVPQGPVPACECLKTPPAGAQSLMAVVLGRNCVRSVRIVSGWQSSSPAPAPVTQDPARSGPGPIVTGVSHGDHGDGDNLVTGCWYGTCLPRTNKYHQLQVIRDNGFNPFQTKLTILFLKAAYTINCLNKSSHSWFRVIWGACLNVFIVVLTIYFGCRQFNGSYKSMFINIRWTDLNYLWCTLNIVKKSLVKPGPPSWWECAKELLSSH